MATPPNTLREIFFASDFRVGEGIATFADLDPSLFEGLETIEQLSADRNAMDAIAASEDYRELVRSVNAMDAQLVDTTAMNAVGASQTARDAIRADSGVFDRVKTNTMPLGKFLAGELGLVPGNFADMDALVTNQTAISGIGDSKSLAAAANQATFAATQLHTSGFIESDYWDSVGSEESWINGNITEPTDNSVIIGQSGDTLGNTTFQTPIGSGFSLGIAQNGDPSDGAIWERDFNFDVINEIVVTTRLTDPNKMKISIDKGGTEILSYGSTGTTTHTLSVGSGTDTLKINGLSTGTDGEAEVSVLKFN